MKDVYRHANARFIGVGDDHGGRPHPDKAYDPQVKQLRDVVLERNSDVRCHNWTRFKCIAWLTANPPCGALSATPPVPSPLSRPVPIIEEQTYEDGPPPAEPSPTCSSQQSSSGTGGLGSSQASSSSASYVRFRWNKNLEARAVASICDDKEGFLVKGKSLSRQSLDAKQMLSEFWIDAADRFNSEAFAPINEFDHIDEVKHISPTAPHKAKISGNELEKKFKAIQSLVTKSVNNFSVSGGGAGYAGEESADIDVGSYNWGLDDGMVTVSAENLGRVLDRVGMALEHFGLSDLKAQAKNCMTESLEQARLQLEDKQAPTDDVVELDVSLAGVVRAVLLAQSNGKAAVAVSVFYYDILLLELIFACSKL